MTRIGVLLAAAALAFAAGAGASARADLPVMVTRPTVTGPAQVEAWFTATPGTWTVPDDPGAVLSFSYEWLRCYGNQCTRIAGADQQTFYATDDLVGASLVVAVTATGPGGVATETAGTPRLEPPPSPPPPPPPPVPVPPPPPDPVDFSGSISQATAFVGDGVTYMVKVHNHSDTPLPNASIGLTGWGAARLTGWSPSSPVTCWGGQSDDIVCPLGTLAPGETATATATFELDSEGAKNLYAFFNADGASHLSPEAPETVVASVPVADVAVAAATVHGLHRVGRAFRTTLHIVNHGPQTVRPIVALHGRGVEFESIRPGAGCRGARCTFGPLAPGASESVTVTLRPTRAGAVSFAAASRPTVAMDPVVSNDSAILRLRATRRS